MTVHVQARIVADRQAGAWQLTLAERHDGWWVLAGNHAGGKNPFQATFKPARKAIAEEVFGLDEAGVERWLRENVRGY